MIKYNFNTHTYKSNYKALYNLESIINTYESENFKSIGISDNINMQYDINSNLYLHPLELKSYLKEIEKIKRKHKNIEISVGFLCDYNIKYSKYLIYLKSFSDYLGLTIKIDANEDYDNYPIICAKKICEAIDTGLFDFITKPDMFLKYRDKVLNKEQYLKECDKALDMICLKAKKFNVPLEINLKYINNIKIMKDNDYPYPTNMFINKLIKYKNTCIVGIDMNNLTDIKKSVEISLNTAENVNSSMTKTSKSVEEIKLICDSLHEFNPMMGHRGCRLAITYPEIAVMQTKAVIKAAINVKHRHPDWNVVPNIMIPLVGEVKELAYVKKIVCKTADEVIKEANVELKYLVGTMIEIPRAALLADQIAQEAEFFSFGTNDLTQMTFGFSRDDASKFLPSYYSTKIYESDPFARLDTNGVGMLVEMAVKKGKTTRPELHCGICGEHGGDPSSIEFCHKAGLDYVSCSPFRVPIARLAAAQANIKFPRK